MKDILPESSHFLFSGAFPARTSELPRILSDILGTARRTGWSGDNLGRLELVLEEGAMNIISHAYPEGTGEIEVSLIAVEDGLLLRLADTGIPFNPDSAPSPGLGTPVEERPIGGLGLHLMKSMTERMEYQRKGDKNMLDILLKQKGTNS